MTCPHLFVTNVIEDNYSDISSQFGVGGGASGGRGWGGARTEQPSSDVFGGHSIWLYVLGAVSEKCRSWLSSGSSAEQSSSWVIPRTRTSLCLFLRTQPTTRHPAMTSKVITRTSPPSTPPAMIPALSASYSWAKEVYKYNIIYSLFLWLLWLHYKVTTLIMYVTHTLVHTHLFSHNTVLCTL